MSLIEQNLTEAGNVLDLGCGSRDQQPAVEYLGHRYVGIDYSNQNADLLADAHALPFRDGSFDCVLSYAVLEHLHSPFVAVCEIERVLKPGGMYVGTVSQGEPFHDSYFHMTPWGLISLISSTNSLEVLQMWDSMDTLESLSRIGRYPRVVKMLIRLVERIHRHLPFLAPRRMAWSQREKLLDRLYRAGSIGFLICKRDSDNGLDDGM